MQAEQSPTQALLLVLDGDDVSTIALLKVSFPRGIGRICFSALGRRWLELRLRCMKQLHDRPVTYGARVERSIDLDNTFFHDELKRAWREHRSRITLPVWDNCAALGGTGGSPMTFDGGFEKRYRKPYMKHRPT